jgi:hypothetical protein
MGSKEGKDGSKRGGIARGRFRVLGCEVDVFLKDSYKDVLIPSAGCFNRQLTGEVGGC